MAIAKRRRASTGKSKKSGATKKRKTKVAGTATTVKVKGANGKTSTFKKTSCHTSKSAAKSAAESIRAKGTRAVVKPGAGKGYCVFKGPKMTAAGRKLYANTHRRKRA